MQNHTNKKEKLTHQGQCSIYTMYNNNMLIILAKEKSHVMKMQIPYGSQILDIVTCFWVYHLIFL